MGFVPRKPSCLCPSEFSPGFWLFAKGRPPIRLEGSPVPQEKQVGNLLQDLANPCVVKFGSRPPAMLDGTMQVRNDFVRDNPGADESAAQRLGTIRL